jgi:hypothetical protein
MTEKHKEVLIKKYELIDETIEDISEDIDETTTNDKNKDSKNKDSKDIIKDENIKKNKGFRNNNIIRSASKTILEKTKKLGITDKILGYIYIYTHHLIVFLVAFVFSFNNNINHLCILLAIVSLDAVSIVFLHGCPLTHLEQKYLNTNSCDERAMHFKNLGIVYKCEHEYEKQIELLVNVWTMIAVKCLLLLFFKTFNCKLNNFNNIFV